MKLLSNRRAPTKLSEEGVRQTQVPSTALYTYLNNTLKSPRLRRMLQDAAREHAPEVARARRA